MLLDLIKKIRSITSNTEDDSGHALYEVEENVKAEASILKLAFYSCVNLIADLFGLCEFRTFESGKEKKGLEYYRWNYEPNKNENKQQFLKKFVTKLYFENEAVVIQTLSNDLIVADSYQKDEYALKKNVYSDVTVGENGASSFTFQNAFFEDEVIKLKKSEEDLKPIIDKMYYMYKKLLDCTMKSYAQGRGMHGVLSVDATLAGTPDQIIKRSETIQKNFKNFAEAENAILPLNAGYRYEDLGDKTYSTEGTRDIKAMENDIFEFTARAFQIPPVLISGQVEGTESAMEQVMTFVIDPLAASLQNEINRKMYGSKNVLNGTYLTVDTKNIRHLDVANAPSSLEKLVSSGIYSVNEVRSLLGEQKLDEEWADKHFMTKNYTNIDDFVNSEKGEN